MENNFHIPFGHRISLKFMEVFVSMECMQEEVAGIVNWFS
jgi:hypothetical protein